MFLEAVFAVYDQPLAALAGSQHFIDTLGVVYLMPGFYEPFLECLQVALMQ